MKKILTTIALITLILACVWTGANWHHLNAFPSVISSWYAKEFCSCHYVVGQDEDFCHNIARQWVDISDFKIDSAEKRVTVSGLGRTNTAKFVNRQVGCVLENPDG